MTADMETITSRLWSETAADDNPFVAKRCLCSGFDVYGDLLSKIDYSQYIYLLFHGEPPDKQQLKLFNALAVMLGNPGPRDFSVQASMSAGAGGSTMASCLMAALAVGAGNFGGSREVLLLMQQFQTLGLESSRWKDFIDAELHRIATIKPGAIPPRDGEREDVWLPMEHVAGFDPYGQSCPLPIIQSLQTLSACDVGQHLQWLKTQRATLERQVGKPITFTFVAAAALRDLQADPEMAEMLFLLLRLPGAAAHAVEQREIGWRDYPFHANGLTLTNDPGPPSKTIKANKKRELESEL